MRQQSAGQEQLFYRSISKITFQETICYVALIVILT